MNNRFKKTYLYIPAILLCAFVSSCYKDKGNYAYHEITGVKVDSFGKFAVFQYDTLAITPRLVQTPDSTVIHDDTRFSYLWTAAIAGVDLSKGDSSLYTLSTKRDLRVKFMYRPAKYTVYLKVTDNVTGNIYYMQTEVQIVTKANEGWVLLNDVNNVARVDIIAYLPLPMTDTLIMKDLTRLSALPPLHGPREINYVSATGSPWVYVTGADGGHKLDADTYDWQTKYNLKYECLFEYGSNFSPGYVRNGGTGGTFLLYYDNDYYYYQSATSVGYGVSINRVPGETADFDASPFIGKAVNSSAPAALWDRDKKRFLRWTEGNASSTEIPEPATGQPFYFKYKTDGKELLYMVSNQNSQATYAIMKQVDSVHVYSFTLQSNSVGQNFIRQLTGTDVLQAEQWAVNPEFGYVFYSVGSKIYEVNLDNPSVSKLVADFGSKKISLIKFHQFRSGISGTNLKYLPASKYLMVATYDPSLPVESCGTLSMYNVPGLFGDPVLVKSYSGFGKIVSLTYRER